MSFNIGTGFNGIVYTIYIQPDGKILVGGDFTTYNGTTSNKIIRLNSNGSIDTSFNIGTGFSYDVYTIYIQPDGKILVGGYFSTYNGTTSNKIIRLNSNGSIDTSFNIGTGFNDGVRAIYIQPDGKILVGGRFSTYNGTTSNSIIRLNSNGSIDTAFNIGDAFNVGTVYTIYIQPDGKILVGGYFTTYKGTTSNRIIRLNSNGSIDTSFNIGTGFNDGVRAIYIQPDGKILVGGDFTTYNGTTSNKIIRLNSNGSIDTSFNIGDAFNVGTVYTIYIQPDGKILVGGYFTTYKGTTSNRIIRLNSNGSIDTSFNIGTGFNDGVRAIYIQPDGKILVGGRFSTYNGTTSNKIIRLNSNGSIEEDIPIIIIITDPLRLATFEWLNAQEWLTKKGATPATKKCVTKTELIQYYNVNQTLVADITSDRNVIRDRVRPF